MTGGNDRSGYKPFIGVLAVGASLDNLPSVPRLTADGGLQGVFLDVVCPGDEVINLGENLFDLLIGEERRLGEVVGGFAQKVGMSLAIVDKRRQKANSCEVMNIIGDVRGKDCIIFDDMIDTAGSLCNACKALREVGGAGKLYGCASHGVLSGPALQRIEDSYFEEIRILDTIPMPKGYTGEKIKQLTVADMFAEAITRIDEETSISSLF